MSTWRPATATSPRRGSSTTTTTSLARVSAISPTSRPCGSSTASSTRLSRSAARSAWVGTTSCCTASRGAGSSPSSTPFATSSTYAKLAHWDRTVELASIEVPALVIGARYDTMDPAHMEMMAGRLPAGRYLYCPEGSHLSMYDDQQTYFAGLIEFLHGIGARPPAPPAG